MENLSFFFLKIFFYKYTRLKRNELSTNPGNLFATFFFLTWPDVNFLRTKLLYEHGCPSLTHSNSFLLTYSLTMLLRGVTVFWPIAQKHSFANKIYEIHFGTSFPPFYCKSKCKSFFLPLSFSYSKTTSLYFLSYTFFVCFTFIKLLSYYTVLNPMHF